MRQLRDQHGGEPCSEIGGVNPAHYTGDFSYMPVQGIVEGKFGYWEVKMDSFEIFGKTMVDSTKAIVDSGTSPLAVPTAVMKAIARGWCDLVKTVLPIPPFNREYHRMASIATVLLLPSTCSVGTSELSELAIARTESPGWVGEKF